MSNSNSNLDQNYNVLLNERKQITKLEKEDAKLNAASKDSQIVVTEYYSRYIVLVFVTLLLVLLVLKFAVTGNEQTGGGNNFTKESIFLLILIIVSIGLAPIINNLNIYILSTFLVILYIIIKINKIQNIK